MQGKCTVAPRSLDGYDAAMRASPSGMLLGLLGLALAIGLAATVSRTVGGILLLGAWALLLRSIHRLGRSGPA